MAKMRKKETGIPERGQKSGCVVPAKQLLNEIILYFYKLYIELPPVLRQFSSCIEVRNMTVKLYFKHVE
jgi:hypothetical protein